MYSPRFLFACLLSSFAAILDGGGVIAQVVPDQTLGTESSFVTSGVEVRGALADLIEGGATRGPNLFHSFSEFSIGQSERVYFDSPVGTDNIFTRITGDNISTINGLLGTVGDSNAALVLMNPNGIVFESDAILDVQGAFTATTAARLQIGDTDFFSTTDPTSDNLLAVQPSALFFNNLTEEGDISVIADESSFPHLGLVVPNGESLQLLGRNILVSGGLLGAFGGQIELVAVKDTGSATISNNGILLNENIQRGNILIENETLVDVQLDTDGEIRLLAEDIDILSGSQLLAGIESGFGTEDSKAGPIVLDATGFAYISGESTRLTNTVEQGAAGQSGDLFIFSDALFVTDGASLDVGTSSNGNGGNLVFQVQDDVSFDEGSFASTRVNREGTGQSGDISIQANSLSILDRSFISAATFGIGDAGNISLDIQNYIRLYGGNSTNGLSAGIFSSVELGGVGQGGDIQINAGNLEVSEGSQISASNFGTGNAGNIDLYIEETGLFDGVRGSSPTGVFSSTDSNSGSLAGNINLEATELKVLNRATIGSFISGGSFGGNVNLLARRIEIQDANVSSVGSVTSGNLFSSGSTITISGEQVLIFGESNIENQSDNGEISIISDLLMAIGNGRIAATARDGGRGGSVDLSGVKLIVTSSDFDIGAVPPSTIRVVDNSSPNQSVIDTETTVSYSCAMNRNIYVGSLTVTGRDLISQTPTESTPTAYSTGSIQTIPASTEPTAIIEPQAVSQLADGRLVINRDCQP